MSATQMPRRITVFLSAPPGDSLRAAREHFHEYVKPLLVAGAMDWDVIEGRKEGDVRAGLAEKIRKRRRKAGEKPPKNAEGEAPEGGEDLVEELRGSAGIKDWQGVQGDLVLGRHTWKEYIRGTHEGWLGPLELPPNLSQSSDPPQHTPDQSSLANVANSNFTPDPASIGSASSPGPEAIGAGDPQLPDGKDTAKHAESEGSDKINIMYLEVICCSHLRFPCVQDRKFCSKNAQGICNSLNLMIYAYGLRLKSNLGPLFQRGVTALVVSHAVNVSTSAEIE